MCTTFSWTLTTKRYTMIQNNGDRLDCGDNSCVERGLPNCSVTGGNHNSNSAYIKLNIIIVCRHEIENPLPVCKHSASCDTRLLTTVSSCCSSQNVLYGT